VRHERLVQPVLVVDVAEAGFDEELEAAVAAQPLDPPRPPQWGGYRLTPDSYEFWLHRDDRLHERHLFRRREGGWRVLLLQP